MNLFDLLKRKNAFDEYAKNMKPLQPVTGLTTNGQEPNVDLVQVDDTGNLAQNPTQVQQPVSTVEKMKTPKGQRLASFLFGTQAQPTDNVNTENPLFNMITEKTDDWKKQGISDEAIQGVSQGLNSGNKELAQFITDNKINTPKTAEEIALAKEGKFNNYAPVAATISESPRVGGVLPNLMNGYRENVNSGFSLENLTDNIGLDGRNKGLAYRVGEGLGTAARFFDSPAGRMLLAYGASNMLGDTNPLEQAFTAGAVNLNARMNDRIYRNDLIANAKQQLLSNPEYNQLSEAEKAQILNNLAQEENYSKLNDEQKARLLSDRENEYLSNRRNQQLQDVENNINGLRGFVTNDIYKNLINSQQIRDNYAYRNMMLNNQQRQNEIMNALRQDQLKAQQQQQAFNQWYQKASLEDKRADRAERRAYQNAQLGLTKRGQDLNYQLGQDRINANQNKKMTNDEKQQTLNQLDKMMELFKELPQSKTIKGFQKGRAVVTGVSNMLGGQNDKETAFNSIRPLMVSRVMRKLQEEKGVATDKDFDRASAMVPSSFDSPQQAAAKVKTIKKMFANTNTQNNQAANTHNNYKEGQTATNRKTGEKLIYRGGKWKKL